MTMYCQSCGNSMIADARFCPACGASVAGQAGYAAAPPRRLFRPLFGRRFAGVCAAFSYAYGWDLGLVRVLAVLCGIFLCPLAEIAYIACWIGIPEEVVAPPTM